jgi:hypothetical protein
MQPEWPKFLQGCFLWQRLGYTYAEKPPPELLSPAALRDENPWLVLAAVLERAKRGNFDSLPLLFQRMRALDNSLFWNACVILLGHAGPRKVLQQALSEFDKEIQANDINVIKRMSFMLHGSLLLWTVPVMLDLFQRVADRNRPFIRDQVIIIPYLFSEIVEEKEGEIFSASLPDEPYRQLVLDRCVALGRTFGTDQVPVWRGELFSVKSLAEQLLRDLAAGQVANVMGQRAIFEASTGIDCSPFYKDRQLQPLAAATVVEGFLEDGHADRYQPGVRYFFGHPIPD